MPNPLSCYILTYNSEHRLEQVLASLAGIADELLIVDSGSTDRTLVIAEQFGARILQRPFGDFTTQRSYAVSQCAHDWILSVDSDEVASTELARRLRDLRQRNLDDDSAPDAFAIRRDWYVMGRRVHCFYPSHCPDFPIRLFDRRKATYRAGRLVHEAMAGFSKAERIDEPLVHYTCDTIDQMYGKMNLYTTLAAQDLRKHGRPSILRTLLMPWLTWFKWYVITGGWKDGVVGAILARYAADTVYQKCIKARYDP